MKTNIGLTEAGAKGSAAILNHALADAHVLYMKLRQYHWNVTGPNFSELHKLFETQYDQIEEAIDAVAERIRSLGKFPLGTLKEMLQEAKLKESTADNLDASKMIRNLLEDHEHIIRELREGLKACDEQYGDMGTSDFLTGLMEEHEKMAWMLRAYLE
ncbi:MAG: Dps family protein [Verrucomicrobiota bacterium]